MDGEPAGGRTRDPLLKRQMLYRLSYGLQSDSSTAPWLPATRRPRPGKEKPRPFSRMDGAFQKARLPAEAGLP